MNELEQVHFMKRFKIKYFSGNDIKVKFVLADSVEEALTKFYIYVNHTDIIDIVEEVV